MGMRGKLRRCMLAAGCLGAALVIAPRAQAQRSATITGRITDAATGQPVPAAQVNVVGSTLGAQANQEGVYTIRGVGAGTLQVRALRVGFAEMVQSVTVTDGQAATLNFAMKPVAVMLTPTVVTATGEQRRVEVGNSIAQVDAANLVETRPINSMGDLLTARAPGVQVIGGNSTGTGARVRIRGTSSLSLSNDPIYVIDGVRMQSSSNSQTIGIGGSTFSRMGDINPDEIESIEVVRGPSAATLYGTDAANGVIVITTKKGIAGKPQWTLFTQQAAIVDRNPWPANYTGFGKFTARAGSPATASCFITRQALPTTDNNYCALDSIPSFSPSQVDSTSPIGTGHLQNYGLQVRGGSEAVKYFVSGEWENERGLQTLPSSQRNMLEAAQLPVRDYVENPNVSKKATARANLSVTLPSNADFSVNTGFIHGANTLPPSDNNANGWVATIVGGTGSPAAGGFPYGFYNVANVYQQQFEQDIDRFIGSTNGNWRPQSWLSFRANAGLDYTDRVDTYLCRFSGVHFRHAAAGIQAGQPHELLYVHARRERHGIVPAPYAGSARRRRSACSSIATCSTRNYASATQLPAGRHDGERPVRCRPRARARRRAALSASSSRKHCRSASASSSPPPCARTATAPSARTSRRCSTRRSSVSWVVSDESFFPKYDWLNQFRLRAAYGASGRAAGQYGRRAVLLHPDGDRRGRGVTGTRLHGAGQQAAAAGAFDGTRDRGGLHGLEQPHQHRVDILRQAIEGRAHPARSSRRSVGTGATSRFANLGEIRNWGRSA